MIKSTKRRITKVGVGLAMALCLSGAGAAPALAADPLPSGGCGTTPHYYCMFSDGEDAGTNGDYRDGIWMSAVDSDPDGGCGYINHYYCMF